MGAKNYNYPDTAKAVQQAVKTETESKTVRSIRADLFQLYLMLAVVLFAALALSARTVAYFSIDLSITRGVQAFHAGWFDALMRAISWIGFPPQTFFVIPIAAGLLYLAGLRWEAVMSIIAGVGVTLLNLLVKVTIQRPRPTADLVGVVRDLTNSYSFPSGHVMFYVGFFGFLLFLVLTLFKPSKKRTLLALLLVTPIALIGISRIYLGAHWASDVAGAYLLGSLGLAVSVALYRWGKTRFFIRQPVAPHEGQDGT